LIKQVAGSKDLWGIDKQHKASPANSRKSSEVQKIVAEPESNQRHADFQRGWEMFQVDADCFKP
jgi:hypothetical protein